MWVNGDWESGSKGATTDPPCCATAGRAYGPDSVEEAEEVAASGANEGFRPRLSSGEPPCVVVFRWFLADFPSCRRTGRMAWRPGAEGEGHPTLVLRGCGEQELVMRTAESAQAKAAETPENSKRASWVDSVGKTRELRGTDSSPRSDTCASIRARETCRPRYHRHVCTIAASGAGYPEAGGKPVVQLGNVGS
jgi:hypothetical protein